MSKDHNAVLTAYAAAIHQDGVLAALLVELHHRELAGEDTVAEQLALIEAHKRANRRTQNGQETLDRNLPLHSVREEIPDSNCRGAA